MDHLEWQTAKAALMWQVDLGVSDVILDAPINRYEFPAVAKKPAVQDAQTKGSDVPPKPKATDVVVASEQAAGAARDLDALKAALATYPHCDLQKGARNLVFSDGAVGARVMIVGEGPGREEDQQGKPFVGRAGQLLDKMLAAINLTRQSNVYITNILPYRPPQNRDPQPDEVAMMMPFLRRHIELAKPDVLVCMGNHSCHALLNKRGITKLRGQWDTALGLPVLPMLHPAYLLRQPSAKKQTWADLLSLKSWLEGH